MKGAGTAKRKMEKLKKKTTKNLEKEFRDFANKHKVRALVMVTDDFEYHEIVRDNAALLFAISRMGILYDILCEEYRQNRAESLYQSRKKGKNKISLSYMG